MDIGSKSGYPSSALSNFAPHPFVFRGVQCNSMEGFLQSLKFSNPEMQKYVCTLVGIKAKMKGKNKNWWKTQTLYWDGVPFNRHSQTYQDILDEAYQELSKNTNFRKALLATKNSSLTHSIGKTDPSHTVLTVNEFCSRLMMIRINLMKEGIK